MPEAASCEAVKIGATSIGRRSALGSENTHEHSGANRIVADEFGSRGTITMSRRSSRVVNMPAPYLRRVWLDPARLTAPDAYPFCLPLFAKGDFELAFERASNHPS